jgi:L-fucose mutarotase
MAAIPISTGLFPDHDHAEQCPLQEEDNAMLKNINPLLNPDILYALASMGHGDTVTICDSNFPATAMAAETVTGEALQLAVDVKTALEAVLSVVPIDTFDLEIPPVQGMQVVGAPDEIPPCMQDCAPLVEAEGSKISLVERHAFYEIAKQSFVIIHTLETRPYGNLVIRKGVII